MISRTRLTKVLAVALAALLVGGVAVVLRQTVLAPRHLTAHFTSATSIYPGDEVRVAGVQVGTIESITPAGDQAVFELAVDRNVPIPADAKAIIVAQNLISARYVQLTPAYEDSGPVLADGAVIGIDRTAVPVEWDEVKEQLTRLATELGPTGDVSTTSVSRFIDSAANAMEGNGEKLRETIAQLSGVGRILADGSGDIVAVIKNLQIFVSALRDSNVQIVQFQDRLATVSSVVDGSRADMDSALTHLAEAVGEVRRFVEGSRNQTAEQLQRLSAITQNLVDNKSDLENVLHVAPNAIGNGYNIYNPDTGTMIGGFAMGNFANPVQLICSSIGAVRNATAPETAKICAEYLGPALRLLNFNYLPMPFNAYLKKAPSPGNLIYSDPSVAPGGTGGSPDQVETPPAVSAYTGAGDVPPPPGWGTPPGPPGAYAPNGLPAGPTPALFPGAPIPAGPPIAGPPAPTSLTDMLLPAEAPPAPAAPAQEGNPPS
ncbi:MCE family protein [Mycolicibacterium sp. F2034L]|uniref:MCE family protein n=1 Tax=Mycolicibacterium sp. F2034L TaxID=2926422 RepID=UPI001FF0F998|nr:MCE family protein [Mycolicibacterium sp. F2034L]MCK0175462.1 MCE family protein [Mycolicibacterium sp. F2034L]